MAYGSRSTETLAKSPCPIPKLSRSRAALAHALRLDRPEREAWVES